MQHLKRGVLLVRNLLEEYIPGLMFVIFFGLFVLQIILRSVFQTSISWSEEVCSICYTWIVFLTASLAERSQDNIYFPLLHDMLSDRLKKAVDILHQVILIVFYLCLTPYSLSLYRFFSRKYTVLLRLPLSIAYGGFLVFMLLSVIRAAYRMTVMIRTKKGDDTQ